MREIIERRLARRTKERDLLAAQFERLRGQLAECERQWVAATCAVTELNALLEPDPAEAPEGYDPTRTGEPSRNGVPTSDAARAFDG